MTRTSTHSRTRDERGQATVEFAFMMPLLALVILLIAQLGMGFVHWNNVNQLAGDAVRFAAVDRNPFAAVDSHATDTLKSGSGAVSAPTVCVSFPEGTDVGDPVQVEVKADWTWVPGVADMFGESNWKLTGKATMRLERKPTTFSAGCT